MLEAAIEGLAFLLDPQVLLAAIAGCLVAQVICAIPGLGGSFATVLVLPVVFTLPTVPAVALLIGAAVTSGTSNSITSILFGVPGSSSGVAATFDGYPMAQKGEGARALSAGLTASAIGGIIGALSMLIFLPIVRPLVLSFGPPEFFAVILFSLVFIAYLGESTMIKGLLSAGVGMLVGFVGREPTTASLRYEVGQLYLWDGVELVPFMVGLFAIAEMLLLAIQGGSIARARPVEAAGSRKQGFLDAFRHWPATLQSSLVGVVVGILPGIGGGTAQFLGYGQVARLSKNRHLFGKGTVEGVIAADAANNANEGGDLIPTLAFGIPGSSGMAIVLGALIVLGLQPGPEMLTTNLNVVWMMIWILVFTSVLASVVVLLFVNQLAKFTFVRASLLVPVIWVVSMFAAYTTSYALGDLLVALLAGVLGFAMKRFDYSRAALVIGFVLAPLLERNFLLALRIHGWGFLSRPIVVGLLVLLVITLVGSWLGGVRGRVQSSRARARTPKDETVEAPSLDGDRPEISMAERKKG